MVFNNNISLGLILGSGVDLSDDLVSEKNILLEDTTGVHRKTIYTCTMNGKNLLVFKGRKHFYEGWGFEDITANIQYANIAGVKNLLITNAAGGLNPNFTEGDLMLITSHINFIDKLKKQPTISHYSRRLQRLFRKACSSSKVMLHEGTYGCYTGPTYETRAEIRFQKNIGLDAAGMSTIPEVYEAYNSGIEVLALSIITNLLKESTAAKTSHDDVLQTAKNASKKLNKVLPAFISELN